MENRFEDRHNYQAAQGRRSEPFPARRPPPPPQPYHRHEVPAASRQSYAGRPNTSYEEPTPRRYVKPVVYRRSIPDRYDSEQVMSNGNAARRMSGPSFERRQSYDAGNEPRGRPPYHSPPDYRQKYAEPSPSYDRPSRPYERPDRRQPIERRSWYVHFAGFFVFHN